MRLNEIEDATCLFWMVAQAIRSGRYDIERAQRFIERIDANGTELVRERLKQLMENVNVKPASTPRQSGEDESGVR